MPIELWNLTFAGLGFAAALLAAWFAIRAYRLKVGIHIRGSYGTQSTVDCEDPFVASVTLENMKDRAVVVFGIWIDLCPGYFLEVERFDDNPLIIEPFEVIHRTYDPIQHYSNGTKRVALSHLLELRDLRRRLILSTPAGRYRVKGWLPRWEPIFDWFHNYATGVFYPVRYKVDGKAYGSNIAYLVKLRLAGGKEEAIPLRERDYEVRLFRNFQLTRDSLSSAQALETFLLEQALSGHIRCQDLSVIDLRSARREVFDAVDQEPEPVEAQSWVVYHLLGPLVTWWENRKLRHANRRSSEEIRKRLQSEQNPQAD